MAINSNDHLKAQSVDKGVYVDEENSGPFFTGGTASPVGLDLPQSTIYVRPTTSGITIWLKFGTLSSEWRQLSATDITALDTRVIPALLTTTQDLLNQLISGDSPGVSQTIIFGSGGNTSPNSYLPNQDVPSNIIGVPVGSSNSKIRSVFLGNENVRTGDVFIQQRFPIGTGTWTNIYTISLLGQAYKASSGLSIPVITNAELAAFTTVSLKSAKIVLNVNGDSSI